MVATASQSNLAGLPRRLVQDGIVSEDQLQDATEAAKKERLPLIAYLVLFIPVVIFGRWVETRFAWKR